MICASCGIEIDRKTMKCPRCGRPAGNAYAYHSSAGVVFPQPPEEGRSQRIETPSYNPRSNVLPFASVILCVILAVISILCFAKITSFLKETRDAAKASGEEIITAITEVQKQIQNQNNTAPSLPDPADGDISGKLEEPAESEITEHIIITDQPQSVKDAQPGTQVTFSIKAEGNGLEYEWFKLTGDNGPIDPTQLNYQGETPFQITSDSNSSSLIINASPEESQGFYQCKVTSATSEVEYSEAVFLQYKIDPDPAAIPAPYPENVLSPKIE